MTALRVFVHTNAKQYLGAVVAAYSFKRRSQAPEAFAVEILDKRDFAWFERYQGKLYLRGGTWQPWLNEDLQSFTPLRFAPPERMGYQGRALVVDPDVFAVGDVMELLTRDMEGKAILCRTHAGVKRAVRGRYASSVMLLDCAKLRHWQAEAQFAELFSGARDYRRWLGLEYEDPKTIGILEEVWNDFDRLTPKTRLLHNTRRVTQPWKTGLKMDYLPVENFPPFPPFGWLMKARRKLFGPYAGLPRYLRHPDRRQEALFFAYLRECLDHGLVTFELVREHIDLGYLRPDALELVERAQSVEEVLAPLELS